MTRDIEQKLKKLNAQYANAPYATGRRKSKPTPTPKPTPPSGEIPPAPHQTVIDPEVLGLVEDDYDPEEHLLRNGHLFKRGDGRLQCTRCPMDYKTWLDKYPYCVTPHPKGCDCAPCTYNLPIPETNG